MNAHFGKLYTSINQLLPHVEAVEKMLVGYKAALSICEEAISDLKKALGTMNQPDEKEKTKLLGEILQNDKKNLKMPKMNGNPENANEKLMFLVNKLDKEIKCDDIHAYSVLK